MHSTAALSEPIKVVRVSLNRRWLASASNVKQRLLIWPLLIHVACICCLLCGSRFNSCCVSLLLCDVGCPSSSFVFHTLDLYFFLKNKFKFDHETLVNLSWCHQATRCFPTKLVKMIGSVADQGNVRTTKAAKTVPSSCFNRYRI